ncbi:hypothetical protein [Bradyrhizobium sp. SZCCHNR1093]|uniref:hypothetical protein n=1 Tax=Bradyrhizobium sp. SZCCHNR1093 TaxID=3057368 RepID=UPI0028EBC73D|nr:hypothetical protein [Bradyrhizobium sp. SZCCHNR1093]
MLQVVTETTTAKLPNRRRQQPATPMELLVQIEKRNPRMNRDEIQDLFVQQIMLPKNASLMVIALETVFSLNYGKLHSVKRPKTTAQSRAASAAKRAPVIEAMRDEAVKYVVEVGFWDYPMPNGKRLHECTVKEAKSMKPKIGGLLTIIDNLRGKPTDVIGDIYTKSQLKKLAT